VGLSPNWRGSVSGYAGCLATGKPVGCEAVQRPTMKFVATKTAEQQALTATRWQAAAWPKIWLTASLSYASRRSPGALATIDGRDCG